MKIYHNYYYQFSNKHFLIHRHPFQILFFLDDDLSILIINLNYNFFYHFLQFFLLTFYAFGLTLNLLIAHDTILIFILAFLRFAQSFAQVLLFLPIELIVCIFRDLDLYVNNYQLISSINLFLQIFLIF